MSGYQFTAFKIGQIKAHLYHGLGTTAISRILTKPDGRSHWSDTSVQNQIDKLAESPRWRGTRQEGSGAPRKTTKAEACPPPPPPPPRPPPGFPFPFFLFLLFLSSKTLLPILRCLVPILAESKAFLAYNPLD